MSIHAASPSRGIGRNGLKAIQDPAPNLCLRTMLSGPWWRASCVRDDQQRSLFIVKRIIRIASCNAACVDRTTKRDLRERCTAGRRLRPIRWTGRALALTFMAGINPGHSHPASLQGGKTHAGPSIRGSRQTEAHASLIRADDGGGTSRPRGACVVERGCIPMVL